LIGRHGVFRVKCGAARGNGRSRHGEARSREPFEDRRYLAGQRRQGVVRGPLLLLLLVAKGLGLGLTLVLLVALVI